jgi:hypothetical protein
LRRSLSPSEFRAFLLQKQPIAPPYGPQGSLGDIHWFNYFGRAYVDLIGESRLKAAGWARIEQIGDGFACYATEQIDDPKLRQQQDRIGDALSEFVWSPGCKAEDKRIPIFDYTDQIAALSPALRAKAIGMLSDSSIKSKY